MKNIKNTHRHYQKIYKNALKYNKIQFLSHTPCNTKNIASGLRAIDIQAFPDINFSPHMKRMYTKFTLMSAVSWECARIFLAPFNHRRLYKYISECCRAGKGQ